MLLEEMKKGIFAYCMVRNVIFISCSFCSVLDRRGGLSIIKGKQRYIENAIYCVTCW
jgi:hypothetical protein